MRLQVSPRVRRTAHSPTLEIHERVAALRRAGQPLVHFGFGQSPFPAPPPVVDALTEHAGDNRYTPSQGLPDLREVAADYLCWRFKHHASPERICVGPGSKALIFDALLALAGDLILPAPSWVSYAPQARLLGKKVVWAQTDPARGYRMTDADIERACKKSRSSQKILILNSPGNPTGVVYTARELKGIAAVARRHNVVVISDEIYAEITFTRRPYTSVARFCPERTIITTGLSKGFCAGGHRLGIALLPKTMEKVVASLVNMASETFSCVSAPVQHAAVIAFSRDKGVRSHVEDTVAIHKTAGEYLRRGLTRIGLRCPKPEGAFYLFPDFSPFSRALRRNDIRTDAALCADMLGKSGVAMLPGSACGTPRNQLAVRISTVDYDGAAVLRAFRKKPRQSPAEKRTFVEKHCPNLCEGIQRIGAYLAEMG